MSDDTVVVARFHYRHEAELAHGYLLDAGIESGLFIDDAGGMEVGLAFANPARLIVHRSRAEEAREVLESAGVLEEGDDRPGITTSARNESEEGGDGDREDAG